jgi:hypothetical protein
MKKKIIVLLLAAILISVLGISPSAATYYTQDEFEEYIDEIQEEYARSYTASRKDIQNFMDDFSEDAIKGVYKCDRDDRYVEDDKLYMGDFTDGYGGIFNSWSGGSLMSGDITDTYIIAEYEDGKTVKAMINVYNSDGSYTSYMGGYKNGKYNGVGLYKVHDDDGEVIQEYWGEYKDGKYDGVGRYTSSKGSNQKKWYAYIGGFTKGKVNGYAIYVTGGTGENSFGLRSGEVKASASGYYKDGKFVKEIPFDDWWELDESSGSTNNGSGGAIYDSGFSGVLNTGKMCTWCNGTGTRQCLLCNGVGTQQRYVATYSNKTSGGYVTVDCSSCTGGRDRCSTCGGDGRIS